MSPPPREVVGGRVGKRRGGSKCTSNNCGCGTGRWTICWHTSSASAARILQRRQGHRYFDWEWRDGEFHYFEHAVNFAREKVLEGKYVMQTEESDLTPVEAVTAYK